METAAGAGYFSSGTGVVLRPERLEDAAETAAAHLAAYRAGHAGLMPQQRLAGLDVQVWAQQRRQRLIEPDTDIHTLVADADGTIVGHITYGHDPSDPAHPVGRIWACYLHPDRWGSGIADSMMRAALAAIGEDTVRLWVLEGNNRAARFYQRYGFLPDGTRGMYRPAGSDDAFPMLRYTRRCGP
jgi:ribosomal protein S18 acetylase RimI-like enzyme